MAEMARISFNLVTSYTIAHGSAVFLDKHEDFSVNSAHERIPATSSKAGYFFNPGDNPTGFVCYDG